jgi:hypothetical protein
MLEFRDTKRLSATSAQGRNACEYPRLPQIHDADEEHSFCFGWRLSRKRQLGTLGEINTHTWSPDRNSTSQRGPRKRCTQIPVCRVHRNTGIVVTHTIDGLHVENSGVPFPRQPQLHRPRRASATSGDTTVQAKKQRTSRPLHEII